MAKDTTAGLTVNEIVAHNLREARQVLGMTQQQAAEQLTKVTGHKWTKTALSQAESSSSGRIRRFDADDLYALAVVFNQPVGFFLEPPPGARVKTGSGKAVQSSQAARTLLGGTGDLQAVSRLLGGPRTLRHVADLLEQRT